MLAHLATTSGLPMVVRLVTSSPDAVFSTYFQSGPQMYLYPSELATSAAVIPAIVTVNWSLPSIFVIGTAAPAAHALNSGKPPTI